jgi:hypothetical protein
LTRTQNRELSLRCIAYNMHRLTNLVIIAMVSTEPCFDLLMNENTLNATLGYFAI